MSDTPRTDAETYEERYNNGTWGGGRRYVVSAHISRDIELALTTAQRERNEARAENNALRDKRYLNGHLDDGTPVYGTAEECIESWMEAAQAEAKEADRLRGRVAELEAGLLKVTDHFAAVMDGPMVAGAGVVFENGVEGIPTIAHARDLLAPAEKEADRG